MNKPFRMKNVHPVRYTCPMHPEIARKTAGMCPECGMQLMPKKKEKTPVHDHAGNNNAHAGHSTNIFRRKFWTSLALSIPVLAYDPMFQKLASWTPPEFPGSEYIPFVLGSVIFFDGGWVFLASARRELAARLPGMMILISLAITAAYVYSVYVILAGRTETLFWELATLITIMLLGHWIEMRAVTGAQGALKELSQLLPDIAEVVRGDHTEIVPLGELKEGDVILVKPGGRIAADGEVETGDSVVDESVATGESKPVAKRSGDAVIAGTANGDGSLRIRVAKIGEHTFLAGVMRLVEEAQASKSRMQILSDRAAYYLTLIAVTVGAFTFTGWFAAGAGVATAVERMVAVLVITCPHALGLAVPLVASISTTKAAKSGFLVKKRLALEAARNVNAVLFDKTGTLTKGEYGVTDIWGFGVHEREVLRLAASVDALSEHPVAKAIVARAEEEKITLARTEDFTRVPGRGVKGMMEGHAVSVSGAGLEIDQKFELSEAMRAEHAKGKTIVYVIRDGAVIGALALADIIREESREAVASLGQMGVTVAMITGDSEDVARWVAAELGIEEYFSRVMPDQKSEKVKLLQEKGLRVAMVGDGVNDAPALTQADLGIAIGAGTNVAIESAGIILVRNDPRNIPKIIRLSELTYRKMVQNLFWATGYNVLAVPLAAGVLVPWGLVLEPAFAAVLMSASTVIVAINAVLLRSQEIK